MSIKIAKTLAATLAAASVMGVMLFVTEIPMPQFPGQTPMIISVESKSELDPQRLHKPIDSDLIQNIQDLTTHGDDVRIYDILKEADGHDYTLQILDIKSLKAENIEKNMEIYVVTSGTAWFTVGTETREVNRGDVIVCPPNMTRKVVPASEKPCQVIRITLL